MSGFDIEVRYSEEHRGLTRPGAIREWLNAFADAAARPAPMLEKIGASLVESTRKRFDTETAPDGSRWARNSPVTIARKGFDRPLTETGALRASIRWELLGSGKAVNVGSDLVYAAVQQFGARQGQFGSTRRGSPIPWGDIPARPYLGRSEEDQRMIFAAMRDFLGLS